MSRILWFSLRSGSLVVLVVGPLLLFMLAFSDEGPQRCDEAGNCTIPYTGTFEFRAIVAAGIVALMTVAAILRAAAKRQLRRQEEVA